MGLRSRRTARIRQCNITAIIVDSLFLLLLLPVSLHAKEVKCPDCGQTYDDSKENSCPTCETVPPLIIVSPEDYYSSEEGADLDPAEDFGSYGNPGYSTPPARRTIHDFNATPDLSPSESPGSSPEPSTSSSDADPPPYRQCQPFAAGSSHFSQSSTPSAASAQPFSEQAFSEQARQNLAQSLNLFHNLAREAPKENLIISPDGIMLMLSYIMMGASGHLLKALQEYLPQNYHTPPPVIDPNTGASPVASSTYQTGCCMLLASGNTLDPDFQQRLTALGALLFPESDFSSQESRSELANKINEYLQEKTCGLLDSICEPEDWGPSTVMAIINSVFYNGLWKYPFSKARIPRYLNWYSAEGEEYSEVKFMQLSEKLKYSQCGGWQAVVLPFKIGGKGESKGESEFEMILILPPTGTLPLEVDLDTITQLMATAELIEVDVTAPPFDISSQPRLTGALTASGLGSLFESLEQSLQNMLTASSPGLAFDEMIQVVRAQMGPKGFTAAAGTQAVASDCSLNTVLNVNRPFPFIVRNRLTHAIIFMGQIHDLTKQPEDDRDGNNESSNLFHPDDDFDDGSDYEDDSDYYDGHGFGGGSPVLPVR